MTETLNANTPNPVPAGQTVTYDFAVTNTGHTKLKNVVVEDTNVATGVAQKATCQYRVTAAGVKHACRNLPTGEILLVGETSYFQATYTVTSSDVTTGNVTDSAVATGNRDVVDGKLVTSNTTSVTVPTQAPLPPCVPGVGGPCVASTVYSGPATTMTCAAATASSAPVCSVAASQGQLTFTETLTGDSIFTIPSYSDPNGGTVTWTPGGPGVNPTLGFTLMCSVAAPCSNLNTDFEITGDYISSSSPPPPYEVVTASTVWDSPGGTITCSGSATENPNLVTGDPFTVPPLTCNGPIAVPLG
jgi:hypothetical protein